MRRINPLNNHWYFKDHFTQEDLTHFTRLDGYAPIRLPHNTVELPLNYFDETLYQTISIYKTLIKSDLLKPDQINRLHFEAVMASAEVYVNGVKTSMHLGGYTPFTVDLTPFVDGQTDLWIAVVVDAREQPHIPPFGFVVDYLTYGGIYREVQLECLNQTYLEWIKAETHAEDHQHYHLEIPFQIKGNALNAHKIEIELRDEGVSIYKRFLTEDECSKQHVITEKLSGIKTWTLETPHLYTLSLSVMTENEVCLDRLQHQIGFRTVAFKADGFYLNGLKIKLRGLNRHQSYPYVGYAMPKSAQYQDADLLKDTLGVNVVRSSHYPPSRHFLDRCDQIGLLVFNEIPGWQHIGDSAWQDIALTNVEEMIMRDWNHPCIMIWGVRINESPDADLFYEKTNQLARQLDATRPTGGVRNFAGSHVFEDVYTYNDFVHRGDNIALEPAQKISKQKMPYLVTEHNGHMFPTKSFDVDQKRLEQALRHTRVLDTMYASDAISGAIGWCMFDYNTHKDFGSGDKICYHGVMDMFRIPKYASAVYASQSNHKPYMSLASSMYIGDYNASELGKLYLFTNCDAVDVYKNDQLIKRFYPDQSPFKALPHPPIVIDDLIGDQIKDNEHFNAKDAEIVKRLLLKIVENGNHLKPIDKVKLGMILVKYKMSYADGIALYGKYIANWGQKSTHYRFIGFVNEEPVCEITRSTESVYKLTAYADKQDLTESETYDVTRIVIRHEDANHQPLYYDQSIICVQIDGPLEILGPSTFALIGGVRAFWVKTIGLEGPARITLTSDRGQSIQLDLEIKTS